MEKTFKLQVGFLPPMTDDGTIDQSELQAITLRNAGTATVNLQNGMYTLSPGETLNIAAVQNADSLFISQLFVRFDTSTGPTKKLELLTLRSSVNC